MHHAYLLVGADPNSLMAYALNEVSGLLAPTEKDPRIHPDCHIIDTEGAVIPVDMVRRWRQLAFLTPNEAARHEFIMAGAQNMKAAAQSALLALLEEPPSPCVFFLLCGNDDALLPTVRSRCLKRIVAGEAPPPTPDAAEWADNFIKALSESELALLTHALSAEKLSRAELGAHLDALTSAALKYAAENLSLTNGPPLSMIALVQKARQSLESNPGHGHLLAALAANCWQSMN